MGIPHIKFDYEREETAREKELHAMTLNVAPAISILSKAYSDIINTYGWRSFTIVYDDDKGEFLCYFRDIISSVYDSSSRETAGPASVETG